MVLTALHRPWRHRAVTAAAIAVVGISVTSSIGAASNERPACHGPSLTTEGALESEWIPVVAIIHARLRRNDDLDKCAELHMSQSQDGLRVRVTTADGRTAIRHVALPENLLVTVEALLELPPTVAVQAAPPEPGDLPDRPGPEVNVRPAAPAPVAHLEVGVGAAGRVAGRPLYGGGGAASFAQLA